jgi:hypothetical protein
LPLPIGWAILADANVFSEIKGVCQYMKYVLPGVGMLIYIFGQKWLGGQKWRSKMAPSKIY